MLKGVKGQIGSLKSFKISTTKFTNEKIMRRRKNNKRTLFIKRTEQLPLTPTF